MNMDSLEFFIDSILGFRGEIGARSMRIMSPTFGGNDHDHHLAPRRLKARARQSGSEDWADLQLVQE